MLFANQFRNLYCSNPDNCNADFRDYGRLDRCLHNIPYSSGKRRSQLYSEYSAGNAIEALRSKVQASAVAVRDGKEAEIFSRNVVPGDIVRLSAGSLIPADARIIECEDFFVTQSILTGESLPVEKSSEACDEDASIEERSNCLYMGTNVHSGSATAVIISDRRGYSVWKYSEDAFAQASGD